MLLPTHLAEPNLPSPYALNEPVEFVLHVLPSPVTWDRVRLLLSGDSTANALTRRRVARKER